MDISKEKIVDYIKNNTERIIIFAVLVLVLVFAIYSSILFYSATMEKNGNDMSLLTIEEKGADIDKDSDVIKKLRDDSEISAEEAKILENIKNPFSK